MDDEVDRPAQGKRRRKRTRAGKRPSNAQKDRADPRITVRKATEAEMERKPQPPRMRRINGPKSPTRKRLEMELSIAERVGDLPEVRRIRALLRKTE